MPEPPVKPPSKHLSRPAALMFWAVMVAAIAIPIGLALFGVDLTQYRAYYIVKSLLQLVAGAAAAIVFGGYAWVYWQSRRDTVAEGGYRRQVFFAVCSGMMCVLILLPLPIPLASLIKQFNQPPAPPVIHTRPAMPTTRRIRPTTRSTSRPTRAQTRPATSRPAR